MPMLGPKAFEQSAGFLRVRNAVNPLDNSAVHPESYWLVEEMATKTGSTVKDFVGNSALRKQINIKDFVSEKVGEFTITDIMKELEKPGRDPRNQIEEFRFAENVHSMEDLVKGMQIPGIITNITNFGAFVDIGVKQDGLVHISHLSNRYITDANQAVKLGQKVMVTVMEVDISRKRIALSMKEGQAPEEDKKVNQKLKVQKNNPKPIDPFQQKLMELKKKFSD